MARSYKDFAVVVPLMVGGCGLATAEVPPGCQTLAEARPLIETFVNQVGVGAWTVAWLTEVEYTLEIGARVDFLGEGSVLYPMWLLGYCEEPMEFAESCSPDGPNGSQVCLQVTCGGLNDATVTAALAASDAADGSSSAFGYHAVVGDGAIVYAGRPTFRWRTVVDAPGSSVHTGEYQAEATWLTPGGGFVDLSYVAHLTAEKVAGEVGLVTVHIEWTGLEPGSVWEVAIVDRPDAFEAVLTRDGEPVGTLVPHARLDEYGEPYTGLALAYAGVCG